MTKIVPYKNSHQSQIDDMMNDIALEFNEHIFPKPTKQTPTVPNNYWVALNKGDVIGTIGVLVVEHDFAVLKKMMLKKTFRGKELGVSKQLLETVINWCKENGISKIYLGTMTQFKAAQTFYEKNGFTQISEKDLPHNFLSNPLDRVFFVQHLNN